VGLLLAATPWRFPPLLAYDVGAAWHAAAIEEARARTSRATRPPPPCAMIICLRELPADQRAATLMAIAAPRVVERRGKGRVRTQGLRGTSLSIFAIDIMHSCIMYDIIYDSMDFHSEIM
jgi:hypothetical protein